jgi:citrate synthase
MPNHTPVTSKIAWSTADRITVHGMDLPHDIIGTVSFGDMAFLELTGKLPDAGQSRVFNALLVSLVEHGMTPSVLAARLTLLGAPEALQGAVGAGLAGLGTVFVGTIEGSAKMLQLALADDDGRADLDALAQALVADHRSRRAIIPGLGHPLHKAGDPRTLRLFHVGAECGVSGRYVDLMQRVGRAAERSYGKPLPVNATGAIGALASELGLPWNITRGLGVMARAVGLVGHLLEEIRDPIAAHIWHQAESDVLDAHWTGEHPAEA